MVVAAEYTSPLEPTARPPAPRDERYSDEDIVDDAVEKNPLNPRTVDVELYPELTVNGNAADVMVIGDEPRTLNVEQLVPPLHVTEVVATLPSLAGDPDVVVQYASCPDVSFVDVETDCIRELSVD